MISKNYIKLFLIIWIVFWLGTWCALVGIFGLQKLFPGKWALEPVQNITTDQGIWNWPTNWIQYFNLKK